MKNNAWKTPSRSSPQGGGTRACLCPCGTKYSRKCCDGSLSSQGIGAIVRSSQPWGFITTPWNFINETYNNLT